MKATVIPAIFLAKDEMSKTMAKMQNNVSRFASEASEKFEKAGKTAFQVGRQSAMVGAAIAAPLVLAAKAAVDFEEKMSDVSKTTGMQGDALNKYGGELLDMSTKTRTSINDLAKISEIGGQLGIAEKDLLAFTDSANKFNIALGADFSGGVEEAVSTVGKIKTLFKETRDLNIADAISRTGSAINELGAVGAGTSANISDFTLRMGALPDALKMTAQQTLALGTYMEEFGIDSQIAAGGMSNLLLVAGREIGGFAKQMGISSNEAKALLQQDPSAFANRFAQTFKGMAPDKMANSLQNLKIGSQETIKVLGALSSDQVDQATGLTRLATLQNVANKAFSENNSLLSEAEKKERTSAAQMAKLKNNAQALAITVGNALLPVINDLVSSISPYIQQAGEWVRNNKGLVSTIVKVAAGVAGLAFAISAASFAVGTFQKAIALGKIAMSAFNLVASMNPIALVAVGLAAAAYAGYELSKSFSALTAKERVGNEVRSRTLENTIDQRVEAGLLFNQLRNTKTGTDEYRATLEKINAIQPGIIEKYNLQAGALKNINAAEKELIGNILERARVEATAELLKEKMIDRERRKVEGPSTFQKIMGLFSPGATRGLQILEEKQTTDEINVLSNQVAKDQTKAMSANPAADQNKKDQNLKIEFSGLPDGVSASMNGKEVKSTPSGIMPKLATNL